MRSPDRRETARHDKGIYRVAKKRHSAGDSEGCGVFRAEEERRAVRIRSGRKTGGERRTPRRKAARGRKPGRCNAERHDATQRIMRRQHPACKNPSYGRSANGTKVCRREKSRSNFQDGAGLPREEEGRGGADAQSGSSGNGTARQGNISSCEKTTQCRRQRRLRRIPGRGRAARCTNPIRTENRRGAENASPKSGAGQEAGKVQCGAARCNATDHETAASGVQKSVIRTECEWDEGLSEGKIAIEFHDGAGLPGSREEEGAVRRVLPTL